MKKVIIIGAGVSGLAAGIFLSKNGYECEILEKNNFPGGNLTGWDRNGYHIDNCIHWLTGTKKGTALYSLWKEIGALDENAALYQAEAFYSCEKDGRRISFYQDTRRARKEMLSVSFIDRKEINRFFDAVDTTVTIMCGDKNPVSRIKQASFILHYGKMSLNKLSEKFKSPLLSSAFTDFIGGEFSALGLIVAYGAFAAGNGALPYGGSCDMANRIVNKYISLGGKIKTNAEVEKIIIRKKRARGVILSGNIYKKADYVVVSCDPSITFSKFLPYKSMPSRLKYLYSRREEFPVFSAYHVAFSTDTGNLQFKGTAAFDIPPLYIDGRYISRLTLREFSHEKGYAPEGKSIIQCMIFLHEKSCLEWIELKKNQKEEYKIKKERLAHDIAERVETIYPNLKGKIYIVDSWTPATYKKYFNSYCGSFMSFAVTGKKIPLPSQITPKGFYNIVLAGQWMQAPGGLPIAARSGKTAAERIISM